MPEKFSDRPVVAREDDLPCRHCFRGVTHDDVRSAGINVQVARGEQLGDARRRGRTQKPKPIGIDDRHLGEHFGAIILTVINGV